MKLEKYSKPSILTETNVRLIMPLAGLASLSATAAAGYASAAGFLYGMLASKATSDIMPYSSKLVLQD